MVSEGLHPRPSAAEIHCWVSPPLRKSYMHPWLYFLELALMHFMSLITCILQWNYSVSVLPSLNKCANAQNLKTV